MIKYVSTLGGTKPLNFDQAVLDGKAEDGGLYVPTHLPSIREDQLSQWKSLSYPQLVFEILSLFITDTIIPSADLKNIIKQSFSTFLKEEIILHRKISSSGLIIQELFHGPTLSFKDVAMGFVVNLFEYFLGKRKKKATVIVATSGDTGPAAAYASLNKKWVDTWVLYPKDLITMEQERQMTTLATSNVHAIGVMQCPDGSDDLDAVIAHLFSDNDFREQFNLSSVNSINWGRILLQTAHYFFGYLQNVEAIGDPINFSVPTGAFGNLCAGYLAREMGLPVNQFILANNKNACLAEAFSKGIFNKRNVTATPSSAIDISVPLNFWRFLYFQSGRNPQRIEKWMQEFDREGRVAFDSATHHAYQKGFKPYIISDEQTYQTIREIYQKEGYLLDPHAAVSVSAATHLSQNKTIKTVCLATAHPAKFPDVIRQALQELPTAGLHPAIEEAKSLPVTNLRCNFQSMYKEIPSIMRSHRPHALSDSSK